MNFKIRDGQTEDEFVLLVVKSKNDKHIDFVSSVNEVFKYLRNLNGVYYTTQSLIDEGKGHVAHTFIMTTSKSKEFYSIVRDRKFSSINELENIMNKPPYDFWSDISLKDELKRRNFKELDYDDADHDTLVEMLIKNDRGASKKSRLKKSKTKSKTKSTTQEQKMRKINVDTLTLSQVLKMSHDALKEVCKKLKVKPSKIDKNMVIRIKKHMRQEDNVTFFGKAVKGGKKVRAKKVRADKKSAKVKANKVGKPRENKWHRRLREAKEAGNQADVKRISARIKRMEERKEYMAKFKNEIKAFNDKYKGKSVNWDKKLEKEGIWETGMQFLTSFEKYRLVNAKGAKRKRLLTEFKQRKQKIFGAISTSIKSKVNGGEKGKKGKGKKKTSSTAKGNTRKRRTARKTKKAKK
jgi:hypothetical protein